MFGNQIRANLLLSGIVMLVFWEAEEFVGAAAIDDAVVGGPSVDSGFVVMAVKQGKQYYYSIKMLNVK